MARKTVLEIIKDVLSDMDSDDITSYLDTVESTQIAKILEATYYNIIDGKDWPNLYNTFTLTQTSATTPTHLTIPTTILDIKYVKYNVIESGGTKAKYVEIDFKEPQEFMKILDARDSSATEVDVTTDTSGILLNIFQDRAPTIYTSFDEKTIIMDAYDADVEAYLKTAKTQCYGKVQPTVTMADSFYFDLPPDSFTYLINETKRAAFILLKQTSNPLADQYSITHRRRQSQEAWKIRNGYTYSNYGRKGKK